MVKENVIPLMLSIIATLLNYIFISAISSKQQQQTVADFKTVLGFLMAELKAGQDNLKMDLSETKSDIISEIKESKDPKKG